VSKRSTVLTLQNKTSLAGTSAGTGGTTETPVFVVPPVPAVPPVSVVPPVPLVPPVFVVPPVTADVPADAVLFCEVRTVDRFDTHSLMTMSFESTFNSSFYDDIDEWVKLSINNHVISWDKYIGIDCFIRGFF
jgi:hypothetical protein